MSEANCDTAVSKTLLCGAASRDWERVRDDPSRGAVEREEAGREECERDEADRGREELDDDGREEFERESAERDEEAERDDDALREDDPRALEREELEREELDRDEPDEEARGVAERAVVECDRVPRRVGSLELTVHPPLSSSIDQIHPVVIHLPPQHLHQLCPRWMQPLLQCQGECLRL
ncbi:unannotated protein [freshwater metagenome]|uniref:Unannotated protein n=1 Tax=freshwater metagenome TaxID=449393 RepID=A0A6J6LJC4_9ZZZZ